MAVGLFGGVGCASIFRDPVFLSPEEWADAVRARGVDPRSTPNPLETNDEMRAFAREAAGVGGTIFDRLSHIQAALFDRTRFTIDQEATETLTAVEAFEKRKGNCVSFTNLFIALARSLQISIQAGLLELREGSEWKDDLVLVYTHMVGVTRYVAGFAVYDFFAAPERHRAEIRLLDDMALTGILLSNRGVTLLRQREYTRAASLFGDAIRLAPRFTGAWANLGLARLKMGARAGALEAFHQALAIDPHQPTTLHNLAALYLEEGNEASALAALAAADRRTVSPYSLIVQGDLELAAGHVSDALRNYRQARRLAPKSTEPLVALARGEKAAGNGDAARRALEKALRLAPGDASIRRLLERF